MNARVAVALVLGVVAFGLGGYGLGSGWVRFGPPDRGRAAEPPARAEATVPAHAEVPPPAPLDGQVIPARGQVPLAVAATAVGQQGTGPAGAVEVHEVDNDDPKPASGAAPEYIAYLTKEAPAIVPLRSRAFTVVVPSKPQAVTLGNVPLKADPNDPTGTHFLPDKTVPLVAGKSSLNVGSDTYGDLIVPAENPQPGPLITDYVNTKGGDFQAVPALSDKPVTVFGSYLRLRGQDAPAAPQGRFGFVYYSRDSGGNWVFKEEAEAPITIIPNTAFWATDLKVPELSLDALGRVAVVAQTDPNLGYTQFSKPVNLQRAKITVAPGQAPVLTAVQVPGVDPKTQAPILVTIAGKDEVRGTTYYVNTKKLTFTGTGGSPGGYVFVYLDDLSTVLAKAGPLTDAAGNWTAAIDLNAIEPAILTTLATNRPHPIQVGLGQGEQPKVYSKPVALLYSETGPAIDAVDATDSPEPGLGQQAIIVRFKGNALDPATIKPTNFQLQPTSGTGVFDPNLAAAVAVNSIKAKTPDPNSVTLYFNALKPDIYQLVVQVPSSKSPEGLLDLYGNPVQPPLARTVTKGLVQGELDVNGIPKPEKAPNVAFPEFNNPRTPTNGFNPADHVETKVSRLYFYRDARRVAEIINRDLKSYNQAAVDTRRRLANRARDEADALTDERQAQEVKAVRAAGASRDAQRRLDQAQADQAQARTTRTTSFTQITAIDARLQILKQQQNPAAPDPRIAQEITDQTARRQQLVDQQTQAEQDQAAAESAIQAAQNDLQSARTAEAQQSDQALQDNQKEERAREGQFRLEVAAAHEDPNSYAPGDPNSIDPVLQVSVSVIGEGLIQLRGPIKGVNIIRKMINEIDTPAGQVRIAIHTVQINGEKEKRIERVASRIQAYVDHARFLTVQSSQMLRNAIVEVAGEKAEEACAAYPIAKDMTPEQYAATQTARDLKYQRAFFGEDFILELKDIDAEFLKTGNKLLSLHSMDTTSLASALFLLALAKNDIRMEILDRFDAKIRADLPQAEADYELSANRGNLGHHKEVIPLAMNTRFESFKGFFSAKLSGTDTLNPLQREFIKLAQILKSRLVTELEYTQRFKERGLIEDRLGDYLQELRDQKDRETKAKQLKLKNLEERRRQQVRMFPLLASFSQLLQDDSGVLNLVQRDYNATRDVVLSILNVNEELSKTIEREANRGKQQEEGIAELRPRFIAPKGPKEADDEITRLDRVRQAAEEVARRAGAGGEVVFYYPIDNVPRKFRIGRDENGTVETVSDAGENSSTPEHLRELTRQFHNWYDNADSFRKLVNQFNPPAEIGQIATQGSDLLEHLLKDARENPNLLTRHQIFEYAKVLTYYLAVFDSATVFLQSTERVTTQITTELSDATDVNASAVKATFGRWQRLKRTLLYRFRGRYLEEALKPINEIDVAFNALIAADTTYRIADQEAKESRRPIDTKKLLDMLLAEIEDKYIELLEGFRSHTANIDGYVKSIATALDDDFNTQFYYPAFRQIRESSSYWDVQLAQVETTNILTNNRMFAKVEPAATMEFDLPKRDILINEAMNGAKALMDSYGALVADPNFLALAKMQSGQPTSSPAAGFGGGANTVRNVLPGLPRSNDEQVLSQAPAGRREFGSPLEALIPDPAIYKFETGTGFQISPVIQPDGQAVVFHFNYMYTTNVREPVRADEKHLGRVKRQFIDTEVQLGNYELREVSRYTVALKASRTGQGVPLFQDIPGLGILFRPLPSASSSLQQNVILAQSTIFPTLFDLMGLRIAPAVADIDTMRMRNSEFIVRGRARDVSNHVFDYSTSSVDGFLRIPPAERRPDLYRTQETIPNIHPDGYQGPGLNQFDSQLQEGYDPTRANPPSRFTPSDSESERPAPTTGASPTIEGSPSASMTPRRPRRDPSSMRASATRATPGALPARPAPRGGPAAPIAAARATPGAARPGQARAASPAPTSRNVPPVRPGTRPTAPAVGSPPAARSPAPPRPTMPTPKVATPRAAPATPSAATPSGPLRRTRAFLSRLRGDD
ncbi:MAG TPA: hypothetical protein VG406_17700 [Isosphaeraceae bacterium]|jgi:hypothetical protein|nr:hypothetical protein [Isosphaeraceae bacterium]